MSGAAPAAGGSARLLSLDALRGFDMFWIIGADDVVAALKKVSDGPVVGFLAEQLDHRTWQGFTFYDLIFPLFLFMVGISTVFSLDKVRAAGGVPGMYRRILWRALILFGLGVLYSGGLNRGFDQIRWMNVLQRIALCYAVTALLYCRLRTRGLVAVCGLLLVGYWGLLTFVPIRDISLEKSAIVQLQAKTGITDPHQLYQDTTTWVTGGYEDGKNLAHHLDFLILPGRKYDGLYDPEGLLSTIPSIASCLFGLFAGMLLRRRDLPDMKKVQLLAGAGVAALALGFLWGLQFPVIKRIWTSSYALVAGGWSCLLLAAFYFIIDVHKKRRWATPFVWIGMNAITIYLARKFIDFDAIAERLVGGPRATLSPDWRTCK